MIIRGIECHIKGNILAAKGQLPTSTINVDGTTYTLTNKRQSEFNGHVFLYTLTNG